jgi:hypothetical protein
MTNKFDLNKFNSFLNSASEAITCNSECQRNKATEELKNKYLTAQSNLTLAEPQYQIAKQNYYTYISGQDAYDKMMEHELREKARLFVQKFKENYDLEKNKIIVQLETYDGLLVNFKNVVDLFKKYKVENVELLKQLKEDTNDILTNDRKTFYEDQQNDTLNLYYYYILWVIYILIIICFGVFSLIFPSSFNWKIRGLISLLFLGLPFVSTFILGKIIQLVYWIFGLLPKNVYK